MEGENITSFETFGAPDSSEVNKYNNDFKEDSKKFIISKTATTFPS